MNIDVSSFRKDWTLNFLWSSYEKSYNPCQRRTAETGGILQNSDPFRKQDPITVSGLCFQLFPDYSWLRIRLMCSGRILMMDSSAIRERQDMARIPRFPVWKRNTN